MYLYTCQRQFHVCNSNDNKQWLFLITLQAHLLSNRRIIYGNKYRYLEWCLHLCYVILHSLYLSLSQIELRFECRKARCADEAVWWNALLLTVFVVVQMHCSKMIASIDQSSYRPVIITNIAAYSNHSSHQCQPFKLHNESVESVATFLAINAKCIVIIHWIVNVIIQ